MALPRRRRLFAIAGLLLLLALLVAPRLIPAERWKKLALDRIQAKTGLVVEAREAQLSFPWPVGLRLEGVSVRDPQSRTGWKEFAADAGVALVHVEFTPLLRGRMEARELSVEDLRAQWVDPKGVTVLLDHVSARGSLSAGRDGSPTRLNLSSVEALGLEADGTVDWDPNSRKATLEFRLRASLDQLMSRLEESGLMPDVDFGATNLRQSAGQAHTLLRGAWTQGEAGAWATDLEFSDGRVEGFDYALPDDGGRVQGDATWAGSYRADSQALARGETGALEYTVQVGGLEFTPADWNESLVASAGEVRGGIDALRVSELRFAGAGIEGGLADLRTTGLTDSPHTVGTVSASRVDVGRWRVASGQVETNAGSKPEKQSWVLTDLRGEPDLLGGVVDVQNLVAHLADGELRGAVGMDFSIDPPTWSAQVAAGAVAASPILKPLAPALAGALQAVLSGQLSLSGTLSENEASNLASLSGDARVLCDEGHLATTPVLGDRIAEFLGPNAGLWRELQFRALEAGLRVAGGRLHFDRVFVRGDTEVGLQGSIGLDGSNAYRLDVRLPEGVQPQLGALTPLASLLKDDAGRFAFGVNVRGTASQPKVEVDFADLEQRAKDAGEQEAKDRAKDTLKELGSKLLGGKKQ